MRPLYVLPFQTYTSLASKLLYSGLWRMMTDKQLNIKVISNEDGKILFAESEKDFVDLLMAVQRVPLGPALRLVGGHGDDNAMEKLHNSSLQLFGGDDDGNTAAAQHDNSTLLSTKDFNTCMKEFINSCIQPDFEVVKGSNIDCHCSDGVAGSFTVTGRNGSGNFYNGVSFKGLGGSFEMAIKLPKLTNPNIMMGVIPEESDFQGLLSAGNMYMNAGKFVRYVSTMPFQIFPGAGGFSALNSSVDTPINEGDELRMRFQHTKQGNKLEYQVRSGQWCEVQVSNFTSRCVPALIWDKPNIPVTIIEVKRGDCKGEIQNKGRKRKAEHTYIVTNELEILDGNTFGSHVQILHKYNVKDASKLQFQTLEFGADEMKKLLTAVIRGEKQVLEYVIKDALDAKNAAVDLISSGDSSFVKVENEGS